MPYIIIVTIKTRLKSYTCSRALKLLCHPNPLDNEFPNRGKSWDNQDYKSNYIGDFNEEDFTILDSSCELIKVAGLYNKVKESHNEITLIELKSEWNKDVRFYLTYLLIPFGWIIYKAEYSTFFVLNSIDLIAFILQSGVMIFMHFYFKFKSKAMFLEIENTILKAENLTHQK